MKHTKVITRMPAKAQGGFCDNIESDYQALLCFMLQILTGFFLPLAGIKNPSPPDTYEPPAATE
jgi:hypothetical protein